MQKNLERLAGYRLPELAFSGNMLETLHFKDRLRFPGLCGPGTDPCLFSTSSCGATAGIPRSAAARRKIANKVLELRMNGLDHRQIAAYLLDEYGIELFPADILSFLENLFTYSKLYLMYHASRAGTNLQKRRLIPST